MFKTFLATATLLGTLPAHALINVSSAAFTYSQSFDSLTTATSTAPGTAWANDSTLPGWNLFISTGAGATMYAADNGASNTGYFRSFGSTGSGERALGGTASGGAYFGSPAAGAVAGHIAAGFTNTSGLVLDSFTLRYDGEQWRNGGNSTAQTMVMEYGFGASFATVSTWTPAGGGFNLTSPIATGTAAAVDGNAAGLVGGLGGTVGTSWTPGNTLWLRWIENNDLGNDHGLAIDNFSLSVTAVPEPGSYALLMAGLGAVAFVARRRRLA